MSDAKHARLAQPRPPRPCEGPLEGVLEKFVRNRKGRLKGLLVKTSAGDFKVGLARSMRAPLEQELRQGARLRVWLRQGKKLKALLVIPLDPISQVRVACPSDCPGKILVCNSKSCCRRGGNEVLAVLRQVVESRPDGRIRVQTCGCMKACGKGPNLKIGDQRISKIEPTQIPDLLQHFFPLRTLPS